MRVSLLLSLVVLSLLTVSFVAGVPDAATHVDAMEQHELDLDIQQPARTTATPTTTPTRTTPRTPVRTRTPRTPRSPRSPRTGLMFPRRDPFRFRMAPDPGMGMFPRLTRLSMFERRMLRRMFREMMRIRMREMYGFPMSRWDMRMIRMMALRDMMMAMDVQAEDAQELATIVDQREADMDDAEEADTYDDSTETETETEPETEIESEHETEAIPEDTVVEPEIEADPTMIESEFDISAPYGGGYGGFGFGGGYGSKKGYGYGGYGGYGYGGYKKQPYKKVPYKKVPYKKGGYGGYGGYGYGGKKGGGFY